MNASKKAGKKKPESPARRPGRPKTARPPVVRLGVYLDAETAESLARYSAACERTASKAAALLIARALALPWPKMPPVEAAVVDDGS